jgi:hypothetical protein
MVSSLVSSYRMLPQSAYVRAFLRIEAEVETQDNSSPFSDVGVGLSQQ